MPIYEYECPEHGISERLVRNWKESEQSLCEVNGCLLLVRKVMSLSSIKVDGSYSYSLERPSDIRLRERNQALKNKP